MADIRSVCSHPHALPQCSAFISAHGFTAIEAANTAIAAQNVRDKGDVSLAVLGLAAEGASRIDEPEVVAISYPDFFATLEKLGG